MYNDTKILEKIGKKISGLKVTFDTLNNSCLEHATKKGAYINLNLEQLDDIPICERKKRKHNVKYFYLMVLLHEIAHYRKLDTFKRVSQYQNWRNKNDDYNENIADRYAIRYYKRIVKKKKVSPMAIDKVKVI